MDIVNQLKKTELFADVPDADLAALGAVLQHETYPAGSMIFNLGDEGDAMYIVEAGDVRIFIRDDQGQELTIRHFKDAETFGEFALIDSKPRSAAAKADVDTKLMALHKENLLDFLEKRPEVGLAMMRSLSQRARYTTTYLEEIVRWTKWLAKGEYQHALDELAAESNREDTSKIQNLIATFMEMIKNVQKRESELRQQLVRLQVQIDHEERATQVHQVTKSEFFQSLKEQAKALREKSGQTG